jgi:hypothetical protein
MRDQKFASPPPPGLVGQSGHTAYTAYEVPLLVWRLTFLLIDMGEKVKSVCLGKSCCLISSLVLG